MQTFDFTPLYRSTVGFDRLFNMLDNFGSVEGAAGFPPFNIQKRDDNAYRITLAVAGFSDKDIDIEVKENTLKISGQKDVDERVEYLHQGIAGRAFERTYQLADHVEVTGATFENGLLHVDLKRELPEQMKPKKISSERVEEAANTIEVDA